MKRLISLTNNSSDYLNLKDIVSIVLVEDVNSYNPRNFHVYASSNLDLSSLSKEKLVELPKSVLESIHDVRILRKLDKEDLTIQQQIEVAQANRDNFVLPIRKVKDILRLLKDCYAIHIMPFDKNNQFIKDMKDKGCRVTDQDAFNIVSRLHVKDYCHSTLSFLSINWNALLMVFEYKGEYTFQPIKKGNDPVTLTFMDIYIKIDVDNDSGEGYAAMSFHNPEFKLTHPYENYPIDKE